MKSKRRPIKKILLMVPQSFYWKGRDRKRCYYPLGLGYIGAVLKQNGYEVEGLDAIAEAFDHEELIENDRFMYGMPDVEIEAFLQDYHPDLVGISAMFSNNFKSADKLCRLIKKVDPDISVVLGGNHVSAIPDICLARSEGHADFAMIGEGERTFLNLLEALNHDLDLSRVKGLAYVGDDGKIIVNERADYIEDLDSLPYPERSMFDIFKYSEIGRPQGDELRRTPYTTLMTSRGCPYQCKFCASFCVHGRNFRPRDPLLVVDEIEYLVNQLGMKELHFIDDNMTYDPDRLKIIFKEILKRKLDFVWNANNGVQFSKLDREMIELMKETGCYSVWAPVESGDPDILKRMRKPNLLHKFKEYVPILKDMGIRVKGLFIIGYPGETREQMERTFEFAKSLKLDYSTFSIATPFPGTDLWEEAVKLDPELSSSNFEEERLQFSISSFNRNSISREELQSIRKEAWLDVNWGVSDESAIPRGM